MSAIKIHTEQVTPRAYIKKRLYSERAHRKNEFKMKEYLDSFATDWEAYYARTKVEEVQEWNNMYKKMNEILKKKWNTLSDDDFFAIVDELLTAAEKYGYGKDFNTSPEYHVLLDLFSQQWKDSFSLNLFKKLHKRIGGVYQKLEDQFIKAKQDPSKCWVTYQWRTRRWFYNDIMKKVDPPLDLSDEKTYMSGEIPF